jgi:hypothetical protein
VPFEGIKKSIKYQNLSSSSFVTLAAGKSLHVKVDIASAHDLTSGGMFNVFSHARIPIAKDGTNDIADSVPLNSNNLTVNVNGEVARKARSVLSDLHRRAITGFITQDCSTSQAAVIARALENCIVYTPLAANFSMTALNSQ